MWETLEFPGEEELLARLAEAEQVLPGDAAWHYSNLAYALLGHVVAHVENAIREHLTRAHHRSFHGERLTRGARGCTK